MTAKRAAIASAARPALVTQTPDLTHPRLARSQAIKAVPNHVERLCVDRAPLWLNVKIDL
jgi:hypothetical protein